MEFDFVAAVMFQAYYCEHLEIKVVSHNSLDFSHVEGQTSGAKATIPLLKVSNATPTIGPGPLACSKAWCLCGR
jgi:hypothetical protein